MMRWTGDAGAGYLMAVCGAVVGIVVLLCLIVLIRMNYRDPPDRTDSRRK